MSARRTSSVDCFVWWWVCAYTAGLPADVRDQRRAEIASDLWEQAQADQVAGRPSLETAIEVFSRWLFGLPADLAWRLEQGVVITKVHKPERSEAMQTLGVNRTLMGAAAAMAAAAVIGAIALMVIDNIQYAQQAESIVPNDILQPIVMALFIGGLISIPLGFFVMGSSPAVGAVLVVGGSVTAAILTFWLLIPFLIAAVISWYGVRRARRLARTRDLRPA